jgi:hypothetical protein
MAAMGACVCGPIRETMKRRDVKALVAGMPQTVAQFHQVL